MFLKKRMLFPETLLKVRNSFNPCFGGFNDCLDFWHKVLWILGMKKAFLLFSILAGTLLVSCYPTSKITGSWKSPKQGDKEYKTIFIAALTGNTVAKSTLEKDLADEFGKYGVSSTKSIDEFPPNFKNDSVQKEAILDRVQKKGNQAILTISLLKKETESRYTTGAYAPMGRWGYYGNFGGYYNYWYPYAFNDSYYTKDEVYYLETNLYDSVSEELIWSAQTQTYSYSGITEHSKDLSKIIAEKMKADGILK